MDRRAGCAVDGSNGSDGFDKGLNRREWVAGDGSDRFDRGLNQRGWVAVFDRGLLCRAWSARSGSCLVEEVFVVLGRRGLGFAYWSARFGFCVLVGVGHGVGFFFFFFLFKYGFFFSGGISVGSGQWWHGGSAVVVTGQWRRCDRG